MAAKVRLICGKLTARNVLTYLAFEGDDFWRLQRDERLDDDDAELHDEVRDSNHPEKRPQVVHLDIRPAQVQTARQKNSTSGCRTQHLGHQGQR